MVTTTDVLNVVLKYRSRGSGNQKYNGMHATVRPWSLVKGWALASIDPEHVVPWRVGHWCRVEHSVEVPHESSACDVGRYVADNPSADKNQSHVDDVDVILVRKCCNSGKSQYEGQLGK